MRLSMEGIVVAKGFKVTGGHVGIKKQKKDMAILYSEVPCIYAGAFTKNHVKAAPVLWDQERLAQHSKMSAIVINSGNANAVTGEQGKADTEVMAQTCAKALGLEACKVLVCSTGVIGVPLPMEKIVSGIEKLAPTLSSDKESAYAAADAILTTDTFPKQIAIKDEIEGFTVSMGAIGKGSGMIHPNMATLLGFVLTDAHITQEMLQKALKKCVDLTFNMITVDGDTSTNDSVIVLANGESDQPVIEKEGEAFDKFCAMLYESLKYLAISIVKDGEGATKLLEVEITGVRSFEVGKNLAKSILTSNLVKTAFFGEDANWGRILAAMGYAGEIFDVNKVSLGLESCQGEMILFKEGAPLKFSEQKASQILKEAFIKIKVDLNDGDEKVTAWGCDLSYEYVKINGEYRS